MLPLGDMSSSGHCSFVYDVGGCFGDLSEVVGVAEIRLGRTGIM